MNPAAGFAMLFYVLFAGSSIVCIHGQHWTTAAANGFAAMLFLALFICTWEHPE